MIQLGHIRRLFAIDALNASRPTNTEIVYPHLKMQEQRQKALEIFGAHIATMKPVHSVTTINF